MIKNLELQIALQQEAKEKIENKVNECKELKESIQTVNDQKADFQLKRVDFGRNLLSIANKIITENNMESDYVPRVENLECEQRVYEELQVKLALIYSALKR